LPTIGFGIAWASILTIPYAIVSENVPSRQTGLYMGIFNIFVVIPQIVVSLGLGWVMVNYFNDNFLSAVVLGGVFLIIAALLVPLVDDSIER
jgi:maltose/moltooligosaccharide transporter